MKLRDSGFNLQMTWRDLLFMHWPASKEVLRRFLPRRLELETFEGRAWIGVIPFHVTDIALAPFPPLPSLSEFSEINVRTYVSYDGKPGVWFFSLDAANPLAVSMARSFFHLSYFRAKIDIRRQDGRIFYNSVRTHKKTKAVEFDGDYRPSGPVAPAAEGSLDHWLTARYSLYSADEKGGLYRCDIRHPQWPLQPAECRTKTNTMLEPLGMEVPEKPPLLHFAKELQVHAAALVSVDA